MSIAVSGDDSAAPIALPNGASGLESPNLAALIRAGAEAMAGAAQAIDRLTLANGRFEIDNDATHRSVTYKDFNLDFDHSGEEAIARISAIGPTGPWTMEAQASAGDAPTLAIEARDVSLADLEAFDKKPPPLFAEGPISFKFNSRLAPDETIQSLTGRFAMGAGEVRLNNPDALPVPARRGVGQGRMGERRQAASHRRPRDPGGRDAYRRARLGGAAGRLRRRLGRSPRIEGHAVRTRTPGREGRRAQLPSSPTPAFCRSNRASSSTTSQRRARPSTSASTAEVAPDGPGVSLKLDIKINPSVTPDVMRLWPQFINPDVRDWCSQNLHGGQIQGTMAANWSAADLDAMDHKRAVSRESVHGAFSTRDVGVDLMPGLPMMVSGQSSGTFTGRDFTVAGDHATMTLSPTRRIQADNLVFTIPDTTPREIVDASRAPT